MKRVGGTLKVSCCAIPRKFAPPCCSTRTYTCSIGVRACVGQVEGRERRNSAISRRNEQRREAVSSSSSCSSIYLTENVAEGKGLIAPNFFRDVVQGRKCPRGQWGLLPDAQVPYWGHVARNPSSSRFLSLCLFPLLASSSPRICTCIICMQWNGRGFSRHRMKVKNLHQQWMKMGVEGRNNCRWREEGMVL